MASYRTPRTFHPNPNPNSPPRPHTTLNVDFKQKPYQIHKLNPVYRSCHELSLKHHVTNKWKLHTSIKHILHTYLSIRHNTHHHLPIKIHPYSRLKSRHIHTLYPTNKVTLTHRLRHTTNNKLFTQNNHSNHKTHPKFQHHIKL